MAEGVMFHDEAARAYDFLGLYGFARCQTYHCFEEKRGYRELIHYYATHYFKLLKLNDCAKPQLIPENWYKHSAQEVDVNTKRTAIQMLMNKWIAWEKETKQLYQEMRKELYIMGEVAVTLELDKYILDVSEELRNAERDLIYLESINYDLVDIYDWNDKLHKKYKKKLGW